MQTPNFDPRDPAFYNPIINGNMDFWQRLTSMNLTTVGGRAADRHKAWTIGATSKSININRSTDLPSGLVQAAQYSLEAVNNTAVASLTSGEYVIPFEHMIEGTFFQPIYGKEFTIGFWMWTAHTGNVPLTIRNGAQSFTYATNIAVASTGWNYYSVVIPYNANITVLDNNVAIFLTIGCICGSTFQTATLNAWQAGNFISTTTATSWIATTGTKLRFAQMQLRAGTWAADDLKNSFVRTGINYADELALCQRYFEKSYDVETVVDTITSTGCEQYLTQGANSEQRSWGFRVTKRAIPTMAFKDPVTGTPQQVDRARNVTTSTQVFLGGEQLGQRGFGTQTASTGGQIIRFHWTADADY